MRSPGRRGKVGRGMGVAAAGEMSKVWDSYLASAEELLSLKPVLLIFPEEWNVS